MVSFAKSNVRGTLFSYILTKILPISKISKCSILLEAHSFYWSSQCNFVPRVYGNYSREETIQGGKLYVFFFFLNFPFSLIDLSSALGFSVPVRKEGARLGYPIILKKTLSLLSMEFFPQPFWSTTQITCGFFKLSAGPSWPK